MSDLLASIRATMDGSELLRDVASVRGDHGISFALGSARTRALTQDEIERLEALGNWAEDWASVRVADGFDPATVRHSRFQGEIVLGRFSKPVSLGRKLSLLAGIYRSTLVDCAVGNDVLIQDVRLLTRHAIGVGAVILDCGQVVCDDPTSFGNGDVLPLGVETGGREVAAYAEIDVSVASHIARERGDRQLQQDYARLVSEYAKRAVSERGIIGPGAVLRNTPEIRNTYLGAGARVEGATAVIDSTLLSSADEPTCVSTAACVRNSLLQWGCAVETMALVEGSVLTEHSHAERHGKVIGSLVGPNSGIAEGEVNSSLLGPFVGFHHQALLIAAVWPEGKGNVAYGANVGSNHTSRMPDQEFWPGEGAYLGLGANIKYPSDFSRAPYIVVAMGVSTLPQKLMFPFSLLSAPWEPAPDVPPAYNEIIPAWVLRDNLYMLKRNEGKYRARNRARRTPFDFTVFRPDTIELMRDAIRRLEAAPPGRAIYTEDDVDGVGKNLLRAENIRPAIEAYRFHILHYALLGLLSQVTATRVGLRAAGNGPGAAPGDRAGGPEVRPAELLVTPSNVQPWEHQRRLLSEEWHLTDVCEALRLLPDMLERVAHDVEQSKAKDDVRGQRILDDYADTHTLAADDVFVQQTWAKAKERIAEVHLLLSQLDESP
jgi:hypothetical protein